MNDKSAKAECRSMINTDDEYTYIIYDMTALYKNEND